MGQAMTAREAHSLRIREALIKACGELLAEKPIDAITINNIVETAGVAKGSFYNHFPDKESLAAEVSSVVREEMKLVIQKSNENVTDPAYKIARAVSNHVQLAVNDPRRAKILLHGHEREPNKGQSANQVVQQHIEEGVESGRFSQRSKEAGLLLILGAAYVTNYSVLQMKLSATEAIALLTNVLTLTLCGFGLEEDEAYRIVSDSAKDIIKG